MTQPVDERTLPPSTADATGHADANPTLPPPTADTAATLPPASDPNATLPPNPTPASASTDARAPAGYVIEKELGRGGMGVVYLARDVRLNRRCALKMILSGAHSGSAEVERFHTEAQAIARLSHPGIVQVFEIGEHDGRPFMALEYCGGGSLDSVLAKNLLPAKEAAKLMKALAEAMQAAHEANVLHRDLKPANVLLASPVSASPRRESGELIPKITDFGLAKKLDEQGATRTGSVMGTPSYMPPEQADGRKDIGPPADIYALGAILYECLSGRPPFRAATPLDTLLQVISDEPVPLRQLNANVPIDLETITHKCLQKDPAKRYQSAQELADDLGRWLAGEPILARPVGSLERGYRWVKRNPVVASLTAAVFLVLTAGIVVSSALAYWAVQSAEQASRQKNLAVLAAADAERQKIRAQENATEAERQRGEAIKQTALAQEQKALAEERLRRSEWLVYSGKLTLAHIAFEESKIDLAMQALDECQTELRGWEHRYLATRFQSKKTLQAHSGGVTSLALHGNSRLLTGGADRRAKLWDLSNGRELRTFANHKGPVSSVALSLDGKRAVTGSYDRTAKVWDTETGDLLTTLDKHTHAVTAVATDALGLRIITGTGDPSRAVKRGDVQVWDARGRLLFALKGHTDTISAVAFSPDGERIVTASYDGTARLWNAEDGAAQSILKGHSNFLTGAAFSPDGDQIVTTSGDGTARVWDADSGKELKILRGHPFHVYGAAFGPKGERVVTCGWEGAAKVWDVEEAEPLFKIRAHAAQVRSVAFSRDGSLIVTGGDEGTVKLWDGKRGQEALRLEGALGGLSSDGMRAVTCGSDQDAYVWDVASGKFLFGLKGHQGKVTDAAFGRNTIVTCSEDKTIKIWDAADGKLLRTLTSPKSEVLRMALSSDGQKILTATDDNLATLWDIQKGNEILSLKGHNGEVASVAFSPDGQRLLTGSMDRTAKVWDATKGTELLTLKGHTGGVVSALFSIDGARIVTGGNDDMACVWDAATGKLLLQLKGHRGAVRALALSPDGSRLFTGSTDETVKVWNLPSGQEICTLRGLRGWVNKLTFGPNGKFLLVVEGGVTWIWQADR